MTSLAHAPVAPLLLALGAALLLTALATAPLSLQRALAGGALLANLVLCVGLVLLADRGAPLAYSPGGWPAPFGICLVLDRLAAWMLLVTALVALLGYGHACSAGEDRDGPRFHALYLYQLFGIEGAFLTADLFNLFVFFEVLLIASYALLAHGGGAARIRATTHVVVLNLLGSLLFLVGVACVYGALGTVSFADLANRVPAVASADAGLLRVGAFLLLVVFALKAAALPLGFWLPRAYAVAPAGVAALFAVLTKVGVYAILRLYSLVFACFGAGPCGAGGLVLPLGLATILAGMLGGLAATRLKTLAAHLLLVSVGTLLVAVGSFREAGLAAAVYYLAHSTIAGAALFLVADLIARARGTAGDRLEPGGALARPALLGTLYAGAAVGVLGLPPLSGFLGKLAILRVSGADAAVVWSVVLAATLLGIIVAARAGSTLFWRRQSGAVAAGPAGRAAALAAGLAVALLALLALAAGPAFDYAGRTARQLLDRGAYVEAVYGAATRPAAP